MDATRFFLRLLTLAVLVGCTAIHAEVKPETAIHYRQSVYRVILWNFLPMSDMVKGKTAFDAKEFAKHAERIALLAPQLLEGFTKGSDQGAQTDAKAEIWNNFDDFENKMNTFIESARNLNEVAKNADEAKIKSQFQKMAGACKSCHDKYRAD